MSTNSTTPLTLVTVARGDQWRKSALASKVTVAPNGSTSTMSRMPVPGSQRSAGVRKPGCKARPLCQIVPAPPTAKKLPLPAVKALAAMFVKVNAMFVMLDQFVPFGDTSSAGENRFFTLDKEEESAGSRKESAARAERKVEQR